MDYEYGVLTGTINWTWTSGNLVTTATSTGTIRACRRNNITTIHIGPTTNPFPVQPLLIANGAVRASALRGIMPAQIAKLVPIEPRYFIMPTEEFNNELPATSRTSTSTIASAITAVGRAYIDVGVGYKFNPLNTAELGAGGDKIRGTCIHIVV
jgi:hypothetical protein